MASATTPARRLHPLPVRIMHWVNALAMIIMIGSGFGIYNDEAIFGWIFFPHWIVLGRWAPDHLAWHFAGMWLFAVNGLLYLFYGLATGRFRERLFPISAREVVGNVGDVLRFRLAHADLTTYNAVQKILYLGVILAAAVQVVTGLALWKPVQFWYLAAPFGDFQGLRIAHFLGMAAIVGFLVVHVALAILVPRTLVAMVTGGPDLPPRGARVTQAAE